MVLREQRPRRRATEGARLSSVLPYGVPTGVAIVSDEAGQFNVRRQGLCWVHTARLIHQLIPLHETHRHEIDRVRGQVWAWYADLKDYKKHPAAAKHVELAARFDTMFTPARVLRR